MSKIYLLWSGNGPFLDVGKYIVGAFPSRKKAMNHAKEFLDGRFFQIEEITYYG